MTCSTALRVDSSLSGHRWPYTFRVVVALRWTMIASAKRNGR